MNLNHSAANDSEQRAPISERRLIALTARARLGDTGKVMDDGDEGRRRKVLADPALHKAVLGIIRLRGVPEFDAHDILNDVIEAACQDPNLPLDDFEQTRIYVGAIARHKSIDRARARKRQKDRIVETDESTPGADSASIEDRILASRLLEEGRTRYPRTHAWFERFAVWGHSQAQIAADAKVSTGYVSSEIYNIRRTLRAFALAGIAAALLLAFALRKWIAPGSVNHEPIANSATSAPPPPPVPSAPPVSVKPATPPEAVALRQRARDEFDRGQWDLAASDFKKADNLDPDGATAQDIEMRRESNVKLDELWGKPLRR